MEYQGIHHDATVAVREASRKASDEIAAAHAAGLSVERISEVLRRPVSVIRRASRHMAPSRLVAEGPTSARRVAELYILVKVHPPVCLRTSAEAVSQLRRAWPVGAFRLRARVERCGPAAG